MNLEIEWLKAAYLDLESMKYIVNVEHLAPKFCNSFSFSTSYRKIT
ncbi:MAG: hypothetical protein U9Q33_08650 [Campylobacterota bacterium]|nr:hypothetical protein [Campylobacterota bacterium]